MAAVNDDIYQQSITNGHTPDQVNQYLLNNGINTPDEIDAYNINKGYTTQAQLDATRRAQQYTGPTRIPSMVAREFTSGLETVPSLVARYSNKLFGTNIPDVEAWSNREGWTNNPAYMPGYGPNPEEERYLAAGARGFGEMAPFVPFAGPLGGAALAGSGIMGGMSAEGTKQLFPNNQALQIGVPLVAGALGGGIKDVVAASRAAADLPKVSDVVTDVMGRLGYPNATIQSAGDAVKTELATRTPKYLADNGLTSLANTKTQNVANAIAKDPVIAQKIRQIMPDQADHVAASLLDRSAGQFKVKVPGQAGSGIPRDSINALLPDLGMRGDVEGALTRQMAERIASRAGSSGDSVLRMAAGSGAGALLHALGLTGGVSELVSSFGGEVAFELAHRAGISGAKKILGLPFGPTGRSMGLSAGYGALAGSNAGQQEPDPNFGYSIAPATAPPMR